MTMYRQVSVRLDLRVRVRYHCKVGDTTHTQHEIYNLDRKHH